MTLTSRVALGAVILLTTAGTAMADVRPDPTDPTGPYGIGALVVLALGGLGYLFYRRRRK